MASQRRRADRIRPAPSPFGLVFSLTFPQNTRMSSLVKVAIHSSQFPERVRRDLIESLRLRQVNHKFHYDSLKQTQKWLLLHQALSPSRLDADCAAAYDQSFVAAVSRTHGSGAHVVGLGCGGGQKDARLLRLLHDSGREVFYTPSDVSASMVLVARQAALSVIPSENCFPLVWDLASAENLEAALPDQPGKPTCRLVTFFGMLPNFEPDAVLPRIAGLLRSGDFLLLSANLAPGPDFGAGVRRILPQYDNELTRDWLLTFLLDLGINADDGQLRFCIEDGPSAAGLKRVAAYFRFGRSRELRIDDERIEFRTGEDIRIFFSYRHTPGLVQTLMRENGLRVLDQWITRSEEEGVFLVVRD